MLHPLTFSRRSAGFLIGLVFSITHDAQAAVDPGEILISEMNCVACHEAAGPIQSRLDSRPSPRLDAAHAVRVNPPWLRAFLENPQAAQPGTLMPDLLAGLEPAARAEAAEALTHYLVELRGTGKPSTVEASARTLETGKTLYHTVGCVACHTPEELPAQKAGQADAAAELQKLRQTSVPLGALEKKYSIPELASFLEDPLKSRPGGRMPSLKLSSAEARAIAVYLLRAPAVTNPPEFVPDAAKAQRGQELFTALNCAACHPVDGPGRKAKPLAELNARQPSGCLGARPKAGVPRFEITDRQRIVMHAQIGHQEALREPLTSEQQITRTMTTLNCYACHTRGRRGGAEGLRRDYFTSTGNLGDEGRIPPTLNKVGAKLRAEGIRAVLIEGRTAHPHTAHPQMNTRMPLYGEENIRHLPEIFAEADTQ
jgi:mono/diheme cytochrome c family protein